MEKPGKIGILSGKKVTNQKAASLILKKECRQFSSAGEALVPFSRVEAALKILVISWLCFNRGFFVMEIEDEIFVYLRDLFDIPSEKTYVDAIRLGQQVYADGRIMWTCTPQVFNMRRTCLLEMFTHPRFQEKYEREGQIQYFGLQDESPTHVLPFFVKGNIIGIHKKVPPEGPSFKALSSEWLLKFGIPLPPLNKIGEFVEIEFGSEMKSTTFSPSCCLFDYRPSLNYNITNQRANLIFDNFFEILDSCCGTFFSFDDPPEGIPPTKIAFSSSFSSASNLHNTKQMNIVRKDEQKVEAIESCEPTPETPNEPEVNRTEQLYIPNFSRRISAPQTSQPEKAEKSTLTQVSFKKRTTSVTPSLKRKRDSSEKDTPAKRPPPKKDQAKTKPKSTTTKTKPATKSKSLKETTKSPENPTDQDSPTKPLEKSQSTKKGKTQPTTKKQSTKKKESTKTKKELEKKGSEKIVIALEQVENGSIQKLKVSELKSFCQDQGLRGLNKKKKSDLISMISTFLRKE